MLGRRIVIGISGGIAAYKIPALIRLLRKQDCEIKTILSTNARELVGIEALRTISGNPVYTEESSNYDMDHIRLAEWADLFLICPATANTIAKVTHGIADNLLTTMALSIPQHRLIIVPAMNTTMWNSLVTQENIATLRRRAIKVLDVADGELACNQVGPGRMQEIDYIADYIVSLFKSSKTAVLKGKKVLISSGPTEEPLDPVRVITNKSSGKMGAALARTAVALGADVVVVSGPTNEPFPSEAKVIRISTACELREALLKEFTSSNICIMAAAVSDFRPAQHSDKKIEREKNGTFTLELVPNPDILAELGSIKGDRVLVGFALETNNGEQRAFEKLVRKKCDFIVLNHADKSLGTSTTQISIVSEGNQVVHFPSEDKDDAALRIMNQVSAKLGI